MEKIRNKAVANAPDKKLAVKKVDRYNKTASASVSLKEEIKSTITPVKARKSIDLRKVPRDQKIKAIKFYETSKKAVKYTALIGFLSVSAYAATNIDELPTLSLQNNVLNIKIGNTDTVASTSVRKSLTSLAADENALGQIDMAPFGNIDTAEVKDGKFGATGKLKKYFKRVNGSSGGFFVVPQGDVNKVIFPRLKDQYGSEFTADEIKTFVEKNGIKNAEVKLSTYPMILKDALENMDGVNSEDLNYFFDTLKNKKALTYDKKNKVFTLHKSRFGDNYEYYSDFVKEMSSIYNNKINVKD